MVNQKRQAYLDMLAGKGSFKPAPPVQTKTPDRTFLGTLGDLGVTAAKSVIGVGEAAVGLADIPTMGYAGKTLEKVTGYDPEKSHKFLADYYSAPQKEAFKNVSQAEGFGETVKESIKNPSTIIHSVLESVPSMFGGAGIARGLAKTGLKAAPMVLGAIGEGTIQAGHMAESTRQESETGLLTSGQSAMAVGSGIGTGALGFIGGKIANKLGIHDIDTMLASGKFAETSNKGIIRRIIEGGISEGAFEELPQTAQEQIWSNAALDKPLMEGVEEAAATGLLTGAAMGGGANIFTQAGEQEDPAKAELEQLYTNIISQGTEQVTKTLEDLEKQKVQNNNFLNDPEALQAQALVLGIPVEELTTALTDQNNLNEQLKERLQEFLVTPEERFQQGLEAAPKEKAITPAIPFEIKDPTTDPEAAVEMEEQFNQANAEFIQRIKNQAAIEGMDFDEYDPQPDRALIQRKRNQEAIDELFPEEESFNNFRNRMNLVSEKDFKDLSLAEKAAVIKRERSVRALIRRQREIANPTTFEEKELNRKLAAFEERIADRETRFYDIVELEAQETGNEIPILEGPAQEDVILTDSGQPSDAAYDPFEKLRQRLGGRVTPIAMTSPESLLDYSKRQGDDLITQQGKPYQRKQFLEGLISELPNNQDYEIIKVPGGYIGRLKEGAPIEGVPIETTLEEPILEESTEIEPTQVDQQESLSPEPSRSPIEQQVEPEVINESIETIQNKIKVNKTQIDSLLGQLNVATDKETKNNLRQEILNLSAENQRLQEQAVEGAQFEVREDRISDQVMPLEDTKSKLTDTSEQGGITRRNFIKQGIGILAWASTGFNPGTTFASNDGFKAELQNKNQSAKGLLSWISQNSSNSHFQKLAKDLIELLPDANNISLNVSDVDMIFSGTATVDRKNGKITININGNGQKESTFLHEIIHAVIISRYDMLNYYIANPGKFGIHNADQALKQYHKVWREFRSAIINYSQNNNLKKSDLPLWMSQPYSDPDEFITYALTHPELQNFLSQHEYDGKTLYEYFKDAVRKIWEFFSDKKNPTWLDAAMVTSNDLLQAMKLDKPDFKVAAQLLEMTNDTNNEIREDRTPGQGMVLEDIRKMYPGQEVFQSPDGKVSIKFKNGKGVTFQSIQDAGQGFIQFAIDTGQMSKDGKILGITVGNNILLDSQFADNMTLWHENKHVLDNLGMVTKEDDSALNKEFNKLRKAGKLDFELSTHEDPIQAMKENRANMFAQVMVSRENYRNKPLGKMIQRVMDFFNQLFALGQQTVSGLAREVESGKIYERTVNGQTYNTTVPQTEVAANKWYSTVAKTLDASNMKSAKGQAWLNQIKKAPGVKQSELEWSGLEEYLQSLGQNKISKEDLINWFNENRIQIEEVVYQQKSEQYKAIEEKLSQLTKEKKSIEKKIEENLKTFNEDYSHGMAWGKITFYDSAGNDINISDLPQEIQALTQKHINLQQTTEELLKDKKEIDVNPTKFSGYKTSGGKEYKELIITLPPGTFRTGEVLYKKETHWPDIANPLVHVRMQTRIDNNGNKVLHVEEVQSDWDQDLRQRGEKDTTLSSTSFKNPNFISERLDFENTKNGIKYEQKINKRAIAYKNDLAKKLDSNKKILIKKRKDYKEITEALTQVNILNNENRWGLLYDQQQSLEKVIKNTQNKIFELNEEFLSAEMNTKGRDQKLAQLKKQEEKLQEDYNFWAYKNKNDLELYNKKRTEHKIKRVERNPFSENAVMLAMKRMVRYAAENGFDKIAFSTGDIQTQRWGSEGFSWTKNDDGTFTLHGQEQVGGSAFAGMEIELNEKAADLTDTIKNRQDVYDHVRDVIQRKEKEYSPEKWEKYLNSVTDKLWKKMQESKPTSYNLTDLDQDIFIRRMDEMETAYNKTKIDLYFDKMREAERQYIEFLQDKLDAKGLNQYKFFRDNGDWVIVRNYQTVSKGNTPQEAFNNLNLTVSEGQYFPRKEGMEYFYDKQLPQKLQKFFGKGQWGKAKVGKENINGLDLHTLEITDRMRSKALREGMPMFEVRDLSKPAQTIPEKEYLDVHKQQTNLLENIKQTLRMKARDVKLLVDKSMGSISTRLKNVNPMLSAKLREMDFKTSQSIVKALHTAQPLMKKAKTMSATDKTAWDWARKNSDVGKINQLTEKYGMVEDYNKLRDVLDQIRKDALDVGYSVGFLEDYWPRVLKDREGFLQATKKISEEPVFTKAINAQADKMGLTRAAFERDFPELKADIISNLILGRGLGIGGPGNIQGRVFDQIDKKYAKFYMDSDAALMQYIYSMTKKIEARRFFGKVPAHIAAFKKQSRTLQTKLLKYQELEALANSEGRETEAYTEVIKQANDDLKLINEKLEAYKHQRDYKENIGTYIDDLMMSKQLEEKDEKTVRDILDARFHEHGTTGIVNTYKNLAYIDTMGNPISALTQIGDLAWAAYVGNVWTPKGFTRTTKNLIKSIFNKSNITKEDLGIERIAQEFADADSLSNAVSKIFKAVGLEKMDSIGKETLINNAYDNYKEQAKTEAGRQQLLKQIRPIFGTKSNKVINDLLGTNITADVKLLVYNRLLDFQPVALSEMSEKYLNSGNGRIFYMLKTYTLKQFDVYRNEAWNNMKSDNPSDIKKGIQNMISLTALLTLANAGADELKDYVLGKETHFEDHVIENFLTIGGASRYMRMQTRQGGIGSALSKQILPPFKFVDSITKDVFGDTSQGYRSVDSIPGLGKLYYWHFGKGAETKKSLDEQDFIKAGKDFRKFKKQFEDASDKRLFLQANQEQFKEMKVYENFKNSLNGNKAIINKLEKLEQTENVRKRIGQLNEKREQLLKRYFKLTNEVTNEKF